MENNDREEPMNLDLNVESSEFSHGSSLLGIGSLINNLETAHERIEERIRQLEAVTTRARQRQRWRHGQTTPHIVNIFSETATDDARNGDQQGDRENDISSLETPVENEKVTGRDGTYLVAKALGIDTTAKRTVGNKGGVFDCNICLVIASDPILTCCGHLFCWPCFYQLSYVHSDVKECPVCKGEVADASIIPIYGNGVNNSCTPNEGDLKVPKRPRARRIEGVRQQLINQGAFSSPIERNIHRFRSIIGAMGERNQSRNTEGARTASERSNLPGTGYHTSQRLPSTQTEGNQSDRSLQVSRLLFEGTASFSSLSSALNSAMFSAERLVEDLETLMNSPNRRSGMEETSDFNRGSLSDIPVVQRNVPTQDIAAEVNFTLPPSATSSVVGADNSATVMYMENQTLDNAVESSSTVPSSSLISRRIDETSRVFDVDQELFHVSRRRRFS